MHLLIEVREIVFACPLFDFALVAIGMSVVVVAIAIVLVEPTLVVALEFVVEDDSLDACAALLKTLRFTFVGAIDLDVVLQLSLAFCPCVEGLATVSIAVAATFEQAAALLRQRDCVVARARLCEPSG